MDTSAILFYLMATLIVISSIGVVLFPNPIYAALSLAGTMISLAFVFFMLKAYFIGGVQLIVYAGAVMVLFVMVLMLFDLKREEDAYSRGPFTGFLKIASVGWFCGLIAGAIFMSTEMLLTSPSYIRTAESAAFPTAKTLAEVLFTKYLFAFEILGLLLLLIAVGAVAVSRIRGGTHA